MMWENGFSFFHNPAIPASLLQFGIQLALLDVVLKGFALWRAAKREDKGWFLAILIINSLGIIPAIYLFTHQEPKSIKPLPKKKK